MFTTLVLMGDFNNPNMCWDNAAGHKQSRRFLECIDDNFLLQVIKEPTRRGAMLDLVLTSKEGLYKSTFLGPEFEVDFHAYDRQQYLKFGESLIRGDTDLLALSLPWVHIATLAAH
ncbi:hypothetical protein GRJ2_001732100 [Grus japonensis]|uniref:Endonuclease/exonuclease/phosphatase domain-containing protein n=1 Tax=Grus japonensis TaxID=30415 RepID=A0ABC9X4R6_GRUJA